MNNDRYPYNTRSTGSKSAQEFGGDRFDGARHDNNSRTDDARFEEALNFQPSRRYGGDRREDRYDGGYVSSAHTDRGGADRYDGGYDRGGYEHDRYERNGYEYGGYERDGSSGASDRSLQDSVPLVMYIVLAASVLLSMLLLNSFSVSDTRSDASLGLMDSFHQRAQKISSKAFGDTLGYKMEFSIPETTVVCPEPDASAFGSSADDSVISSVISDSDLLYGIPLVWHSGIQYHPDTVPVYYSDPSIFSLAWKENNGTNIINFCEIVITDGSQFRRFLCDNTFGSNNQKYATTMAESLNAVVAMNGDFYAHRQAGVVVYQGKVYRDNPQFLDQCFIDSSGSMIFKREGEIGGTEEFQKFVDDNDIRFSLSFGPILVEDHKAISSIGRYSLGEVHETFARTAIGMVGERHYLFCLVEGAKGGYTGIDILGLAAIMEQRGCDKAYTLDGGQTAELIFNNKLYSRVVYEAERQVSDIIFFATAVNY